MHGTDMVTNHDLLVRVYLVALLCAVEEGGLGARGIIDGSVVRPQTCSQHSTGEP